MSNQKYSIYTIMARQFIVAGSPIVEFDGSLEELAHIACVFDTKTQGAIYPASTFTDSVANALRDIIATSDSVSNYDSIIIKVDSFTAVIVKNTTTTKPFTDLMGARDYSWPEIPVGGKSLWYTCAKKEESVGWFGWW